MFERPHQKLAPAGRQSSQPPARQHKSGNPVALAKLGDCCRHQRLLIRPGATSRANLQVALFTQLDLIISRGRHTFDKAKALQLLLCILVS